MPIFALIASTSAVDISPTVVDLAVLDPPQPERAGDVAVLVERDRADHAFILDRLAVLDELQRLGELVLAGVDHCRRSGSSTLRIASLIAAESRLAGLRDGEADDGAGIIGRDRRPGCPDRGRRRPCSCR